MVKRLDGLRWQRHGGGLWSRPHCARWGPSFPSPEGARPQFLSNVRCGQTTGWMKTPLGTEVDLGPGHIVLDGVPAPSRKEAQQSPTFRPSLLWHGRPSQQLQGSCCTGHSRQIPTLHNGLPLSASKLPLRMGYLQPRQYMLYLSRHGS